MWLVAGLGNPGPEYAGTRHNLGYAVVELLSRRWACPLDRRGFEARYGKGAAPGGEDALLIEPVTFMNRSGQAIGAAMQFYRVEPPRLIVAVDDMALPVGQIRLRGGGSAGGHKGLLDIIARLGREDFGRVRMGIGSPPAGWTGRDYVLSRPAESEKDAIGQAVTESADAIELWVRQGLQAAMNRYNKPRQDDPGEAKAGK